MAILLTLNYFKLMSSGSLYLPSCWVTAVTAILKGPTPTAVLAAILQIYVVKGLRPMAIREESGEES